MPGSHIVGSRQSRKDQTTLEPVEPAYGGRHKDKNRGPGSAYLGSANLILEESDDQMLKVNGPDRQGDVKLYLAPKLANPCSDLTLKDGLAFGVSSLR